MARQIVRSAEAPEAVGAYSQGIVVCGSRTLYTSGQIPLDPKTGKMVDDGDIASQTRRVLDNLHAVLRAAEMDWDDVVRTTIYLADMNDFAQVNKIYAERFGDRPPARACVQAAGLPRGARVEIDAIAVAD